MPYSRDSIGDPSASSKIPDDLKIEKAKEKLHDLGKVEFSLSLGLGFPLYEYQIEMIRQSKFFERKLFLGALGVPERVIRGDWSNRYQGEYTVEENNNGYQYQPYYTRMYAPMLTTITTTAGSAYDHYQQSNQPVTPHPFDRREDDPRQCFTVREIVDVTTDIESGVATEYVTSCSVKINDLILMHEVNNSGETTGAYLMLRVTSVSQFNLPDTLFMASIETIDVKDE